MALFALIVLCLHYSCGYLTWLTIWCGKFQYVMVVLKGSIPMAFGGTEQPAAYGELVSIGGLNPDTNKKLSAAIASILETKLSVPKSRFFLKFYDTKASHLINFSYLSKLTNMQSFLIIAFFLLFRTIQFKNMHSVYMLHTSASH